MTKTTPFPIAGFSLIEMLVVLTIITILSALIMPKYRSFIQQSHRQQAAIALTQLAARLETYYSQNQSYQGATLSQLHMPGQLYDANYCLNMHLQAQHFQLYARPCSAHTHQPTLWLNDAHQYGCSGTSHRSCWQL